VQDDLDDTISRGFAPRVPAATPRAPGDHDTDDTVIVRRGTADDAAGAPPAATPVSPFAPPIAAPAERFVPPITAPTEPPATTAESPATNAEPPAPLAEPSAELAELFAPPSAPPRGAPVEADATPDDLGEPATNPGIHKDQGNTPEPTPFALIEPTIMNRSTRTGRVDPTPFPSPAPPPAGQARVPEEPSAHYGFRIGGTTVFLDRPAYIGRNPSSPRVVRDGRPRLVQVPSARKEVSSTHVEIRQRGASVVVTDLRSTNGTIVNIPGGRPTKLRQGESMVITPGTLIDIGDGNLVEILPIQRR
jgi:hypothetical protein